MVSDQIGSPTYTLDLSKAILAIIYSPIIHCGIYHYSSEGAISWYDFAREVITLLRSHNKDLKIKRLYPIKTGQGYKTQIFSTF